MNIVEFDTFLIKNILLLSKPEILFLLVFCFIKYSQPSCKNSADIYRSHYAAELFWTDSDKPV